MAGRSPSSAPRPSQDDELSQYDLDVHAILQLGNEGEGLVVTLNHLGSVLGFATAEVASSNVPRSGLSPSGPVRLVRPVISTSFADDLERTVAIGCSAGQFPAGVNSSAGASWSPSRCSWTAGRLPLTPRWLSKAGGGSPHSAPSASAATSWWRWAAKAGPRWWRLDEGRSGRRLFDVDLPLRAAAFAWDGQLLWAVGSELTASPVDDYRWEDLHGGRYVGLDPSNGRIVVVGALPDDVAWGNGGVAVVMAAGRLCAVGRTGRLHWLADPRTGRFASTTPLAESSLGIAHAAAVGDRVLYGFNRGGYRLHASDVLPPGHRT